MPELKPKPKHTLLVGGSVGISKDLYLRVKKFSEDKQVTKSSIAEVAITLWLTSQGY